MEIEKVIPLAVKFRRHFHQYPEVSTQEFETQRYIIEVLQQYGIEFTVYGTGIIARIGVGEPCIALRADMDALRVEEKTGLPYQSVHPGVMHACGHDMHLAMVLGAALVLKAKEEELGGTVKVVFQPSEEKRPGGARLLLPYLMDPPLPKVILGQHVFPELPVGKIGIRSGAFFASSDNINFSIEGKGTHAAMPQLGGDPILAAVFLIQYYQTLVTKFRSPLVPVVLSITSIHGGSANNVIPDRVEVMGTLRTHDPEVRRHLLNLIQEKSPAICELYGCRFVSAMKEDGLPPLMNSPEYTRRVKEVAGVCLGKKNVVESEPLTLGEDFAIYLQKLPGVFWTLGVCPPQQAQMFPLHNPGMAPDEGAIPVGIRLLVENCLAFLKE